MSIVSYHSLEIYITIEDPCIVSWSTNNVQTSIGSNSTDTVLKRYTYTVVKQSTPLHHFLMCSSIHASFQHRIIVYTNNEASINIIEQNKIPNRSL